MLLPLHAKSKSIKFIDSPKLWMGNFFTYLKKNHFALYLSIKNSFSVLKYFLTLLATTLLSYRIGAFVVNESINLSNPSNPSNPSNVVNANSILYYVISINLGLALLILLTISVVFTYFLIYYAKWFVFYYLFEKIKDFYFGILNFIIALRLYKNYKDELEKSDSDYDV